MIIPAAVRAGIIGVIHPVMASITFETTLFELSEFAAGASSVGTPLSSNAL